MDIASEIADYLANAGYGVVGTDIFVGQIPDSQDGIYVVRTSGSLELYTPLEETVLDIYIKNTQASVGIATTEDIKRYLHRMYTTETANAKIYTILVLSDVEDMQRDMEFANEYKITVQVLHRSSALIS